MNSKKFRIIGLATASLFLLVILFHAHSLRVNALAKALDTVNSSPHSQSIIESNKVGSLDQEIKKKIGKIADGDDESMIKAIEDSKNANKADDKPNDSLTQENGSEEFDPVKELLAIRSLSPMVMFSKTYCPFLKKLKKLLKDNYQITPEFQIVELDIHAHGAELQEYLGKVSGRKTVPNVLIGKSSKSRGGFDDFAEFHNLGNLMKYLKQWGGSGLDVKRAETPSNL